MSAIIKALVGKSPSAEDEPLSEIMALGRKALQQKRSKELACALLGLDGVRLPLQPTRGVD